MKNIIYIVKFPNNKVYIGITSRSLQERKYEHLSHKRRGNSRFLYNALRKYNNKEEWSVLDMCDNYKEAQSKETQYIEKYRSNYKEFGYNLTMGGEGTVGYKFNEEQLKNLSKSHLGHKQSKENIERRVTSLIGKKRSEQVKMNIRNHQPKCKKIEIYDTVNGTLIGIYSSINNCARDLKINRKCISNNLNGLSNFFENHYIAEEV